MNNSQSHADLIEKGLRKKKKYGEGKDYRGAAEGPVDKSFLRDMGYLNKKKKKGK